MIIEVDDRITLRYPVFEDALLFHELFGDNAVRRYIKNETTPFELLRNWVKGSVEEDTNFKSFIICVDETEGIGFISLSYNDDYRLCKLNFAILPEYRKQGIMKKCLTDVVEFLEHSEVLAIQADVSIENLPSISILQDLGFQQRPNLYGDFTSIGNLAMWTKQFITGVPLNSRGDESNFQTVIFDSESGNDFLNKVRKISFIDPVGPDYVDYYGMRKVPNYQKLMNKYGLVLQTNTSAALLSIGLSSTEFYVHWEIIREEEDVSRNRYIILRVCSDEWDEATGFIDYEIALPKVFVARLIWEMMDSDPVNFTPERLSKTLGLEGFVINEKRITHW